MTSAPTTTAVWHRPPILGDVAAPLAVVEASAGTGKTWFLERRVVDLIIRGGATIDQILVVTFTDKATVELRARVRTLLATMLHGRPDPLPAGASPSGDDTWTIDAAARLRLRAALDGFDAAPVSTIHGFCHRLLAEESFAARRPFEQVQIPDDGALRAAFTAALRERFARDPEESALLRAYLDGDGASVDKLFRLVLEVYRSGAEVTPPQADGSPAEMLVPRLVAEVVARADRAKQRDGQLDFQDMLRLTAAALDGPGGAALAARVATRHPWALIDEFQDTDPLQWRIFDRIWGRAPARGLTVVGDPKQAIYSFRGGDVFTYLDAVKSLRARGAAQIDLTVCQRSSEPLVQVVNALLTMPRPVFSAPITYAHPVTATGKISARWPDNRPVAPLSILRFDQKPSAGEFKAAVAAATADEVARLLGDPAHRLVGVRHDVDAEGRPSEKLHELRARDILVLTRTNDEAYDVAAELRSRGVACALARAEYLFDTAEARAVADLLDAIARPRDRTARLRAWMTCFFDVDADDLGRALDVPDDHVLAARLHDWRGHAARMDYPRLFAAILTDSQVAERALATGRGERLVTNVHHVFEHLHAEVERSRCELPELVARLRGWIRAARIVRPDDSDVQRQETDRDAVQVMTVHRAKGLEAWVVFLAGGVMFTERNDELHGYHDADGVRRVAVRGTNEMAKQLALGEKRGEETRLAYVALTRARARLYLPLLPEKAAKGAKIKKPGGGWLGAYAAIHDNLTALAEVARASGHGCVDAWPLATPRTTPVDVTALTLPAVSTAVAAGLSLGERKERAGWVVTSYTRIKQEDRAQRPAAGAGAELEAAEIHGDDRSRATPGPRELPGGAESGQYLHDVLEHVDFAATRGLDFEVWAARDEVRAVFAAAERRHGIDPQHRDFAGRMVWDAITQPVVAGDLRLPSLAEARRLAREVEFAYPVPDHPDPARPRGRGFVKGFIDLIVAWDERWWVVDYKSDVIDVSADAARAHVDEHYTVQAELYALACARMLPPGARLGGLLYWFLRSRRIVQLTPGPDELAAYQDRLARRDFP